MKPDEEMAALEARMLEIPAVRREVERYRPVVAKLTDVSLLAIRIASREESAKRAAAYPPPQVGISNR